MAITLRLTKRADPGWKQDVRYVEESISIGRDASNVLQLSSPLVSKLHARIELREGSYRIVDLQSKNGTYLNNERLAQGSSSPLREGDHLRISEIDLECVSIELLSAHPAVSAEESEELRKRCEVAERECARLVEENRRLAEQLSQQRTGEAATPETTEAPVAPGDSTAVQLLRTLVIMLLGGFLKLMTGWFSYRSEFLGMTVVQDARLSPLYANSPEEALNSLLDPVLSLSDTDARLKMLEGELHDLRLHVMGLLDGYRRSVDEGTRALLQGINPEVLRKELAASTLDILGLRIPYRYLPGIFELKLASMVQKRQRELMEEDRGILEKRFFRPAFIQAYRACVSASRGQDARSTPRRQQKADKT